MPRASSQTVHTPFALRVRAALQHAGLNLTQAAAALSAITGSPVKNQTLQWMASKAVKSHLTVDLAALCNVSLAWLRDGTGHMLSNDPASGRLDVREESAVYSSLPRHLQRLMTSAQRANAVMPPSYFDGISTALEALIQG